MSAGDAGHQGAMRYSEEEIAAEEERLGAKLPDELRERLLAGVPESVLVKTTDGEDMDFSVWGPSTTDSDSKGREYPTPGMTKETQEVREMMGEFFPDDIVVAWGADGTGDLVVVLKDGSLAWWRHDDSDDELVAVEVDWDGP
ncbi:hypothetical protein OJ997_03685 [Solirubrobacter phytolaccae]|uniref:Knr4/Smi1-like domain-containing protein n=1 Tax=Solirubrobacter phytolaccae TaxID=1404360 RepID=A0A9X3N4K2_9ACTN|nr:SMI1/KNR4 family protein [Solirubrobacter phytolaccae]MDA0179386.1 hypothetical protein [Solirubrobacter phytolaccae]